MAPYEVLVSNWLLLAEAASGNVTEGLQMRVFR